MDLLAARTGNTNQKNHFLRRPDLKIFTNAEFISCEDDNRIFHVMIENSGTILYTGDAIPDEFSGAQRIDLGGHCCVPAFGDTHIHFASFAYFNSGLDCRAAKDFKELGLLINQHIENHPKEKIILAFGCSAHTVREKRLPTKEDLDRITNRSVMIVKYDGHAAVGNSALIQKLPAAVLKDPGYQEATGWFFGDAFYQAVNHISKSVSIPRLFKNLIAASDTMAGKGIGFIHTSEGVGFPLDLDVDMIRFAAMGLPQEIRVFFQTMDTRKVIKRKLNRIGGCFATALDGCFGSEDAALKTPYSNNPDNTGTLFYTQEQVNAFVEEAHKKGLQIALHAIGDAAIEQALNAFENALNILPRKNHRHIIIHADLMNPALIQKAARLGIHIALQTPFLQWREEPVEYLETILGNRLKDLIPLKSMLDAGIPMASGSDGPCTLPNPIFGIHAACNHPNPDERISALDALRMHTSWCARFSFDESARGTLSAGKTCDFAVLDKNILDIPVETIKNVNVEDVYFRGKRYEGQSNSPAKLFFTCLKNKFRP